MLACSPPLPGHRRIQGVAAWLPRTSATGRLGKCHGMPLHRTLPKPGAPSVLAVTKLDVTKLDALETDDHPQSDVKQARQDGDERAEHHALMRNIAEGDAQAFRALSQRFLGPVSGFATRMLGNPSEGEDVAQETFLRVWQHAERYKPDAAVSTYIYRIARNLCIDRMRRRKPDGGRISQLDAGDRPNDLLLRKQLSEAVQEALQSLPERQQTAITLTHYQGQSQAEAAAVLEISVQALESLLSRARRSLRKRLAAAKAELEATHDDGDTP